MSIRDDVGPLAAGQRYRLAPVGRLAGDFHAGDGVDEHPEGGAQQRLVVGEQDPDRHGVTGLPLRSGPGVVAAGSRGTAVPALTAGSVAVTR